MEPTRKAVVIGDLEVARRACGALTARGYQVAHLMHPTDAVLRDELTPDVEAVAVLVRGDVIALRYALLVEHLRPQVRLVVTLFDRTVAAQLVRVVPNCLVTSPAEISVPSIIGGCLGDDIVAVDGHPDLPMVLHEGPDGIRRVRWRPGQSNQSRARHVLSAITGQFRPHDDTTRILFIGLGGLIITLAIDWLLATTALHQKVIPALYIATRIVATVGPGDADRAAPSWYLIFSSVAMLLTIAFTAVFTAGVVNRLLSSRSIGIVGRRTVPTRDHVVVVGLGQVGLRLCMRLRAMGIRVIAIERDPRAVNLRLAKAAGVPVLIAHAEDRAVLKRLYLRRALALAAVGSDDLDNIEVGIAALAVAPELRVVLRAGDDDVIAETRSLFRIGQVRDVSALTALAVTLDMSDETPRTVYVRGHQVLAYDGTAITVHDSPPRCACRDVQAG
jgi:Trk K+ transport system NAD-binding subunit